MQINFKKFLFIFTLIFLGSFNISYGAEIINENFDSYTTGIDLLGQGGWQSMSAGGSADVQVTTTRQYTAPNSITGENSASSGWNSKNFTGFSSGILTGRIYIDGAISTSAGTLIFGLSEEAGTGGSTSNIGVTILGDGSISFSFGGLSGTNCTLANAPAGTIPDDAWTKVTLVLENLGTSTNVVFLIGNTPFSTLCEDTGNFRRIQIGSSNNQNIWDEQVFLDNLTLYTIETATSGISAITTPNGTVGNYINVSGYYNNLNTYDAIQYQIVNDSFLGASFEPILIPMANGLGLPFNYTVNTYLENGNYDLQARMIDTTGVLTPTMWVSTNFTIDDDENNPLIINNPNLQCGISSIENITACFSQVFAFLLIPNNNTIQNFWNLEQDLKDKIPFVFFYTIKDNLDTFTAETSSASSNVIVSLGVGSLGTITMLDFASIKTMNDNLFEDSLIFIEYGLWILFSLYVFYRVLNTLK